MPKTPLWKLNCRLGLHPAVVHSFGDEYTRYQYVCEYKCGWHEDSWTDPSSPPPLSLTARLATGLSRLGLI